MRTRGCLRVVVVLGFAAATAALAGCTQAVLTGPVTSAIAADARAAAAVAEASKDLLPPGDQWGACMQFIADGIGKLQAGPGAKVAGGGILTEAMRLHVLHSLSQNIPSGAKAACGQVFIELQLDALRRMPVPGL